MASIEEAKLDWEKSKLEHEKVKLLFDYTKFHIGLYATLGTLLVGVFNLKPFSLTIHPGFLWLAVGLVAVAGFAGGIIASSLQHHASITSFWRDKTGPFRFKAMRGEYWTYIEHTAFWLGLGATVCAFVVPASC